MGGDGHTASFFPDAPNLAELLAADAAKLVLPVEAASAGEHRLTLTLGKIVEAGLLALHIEGQREARRARAGARRREAADPRGVRGGARGRWKYSGPNRPCFEGRSQGPVCACGWKSLPLFPLHAGRTTDDGKKRHRGDHQPNPRTLKAGPRTLSRPDLQGCRTQRQPRHAFLRQPRARLRRLQPVGEDRARRRPGAQPRHHHLLQRHAVGASAVRDLSAADQGGGARGGRHRAGCGRRAGHVRRRHAGPARHGAVAVLARRDRHGDRDRPVAQHVRRRRLSRRLRQDRAGAGDRGADLRPSAGGVHSCRADDHRHPQRREGEGPPALCRGQGRPRRTAGGGIEILSRAGHLHLLRHGQLQPDADGDHGPAHAGRLLHQSRHAAARRADQGSGQARAGDHRSSATPIRRPAR